MVLQVSDFHEPVELNEPEPIVAQGAREVMKIKATVEELAVGQAVTFSDPEYPGRSFYHRVSMAVRGRWDQPKRTNFRIRRLPEKNTVEVTRTR